MLNIVYTSEDARVRSTATNPIPIYALGTQGVAFSKGAVLSVRQNTPTRFYGGFKICETPKNSIGLVVPYSNIAEPNISIAPKVISIGDPVFVELTSTTFTAIEYGKLLAHIYFMPLSDIQ